MMNWIEMFRLIAVPHVAVPPKRREFRQELLQKNVHGVIVCRATRMFRIYESALSLCLLLHKYACDLCVNQPV